MALSQEENGLSLKGVFVFFYLIASFIWGIYSFFQPFSLFPIINLFIAFFVCLATLMVCFGKMFGMATDVVAELTTDAFTTYSELNDKQKVQVKKMGKRIWNAFFSTLKEGEGRIGRFCSKL